MIDLRLLNTDPHGLIERDKERIGDIFKRYAMFYNIRNHIGFTFPTNLTYVKCSNELLNLSFKLESMTTGNPTPQSIYPMLDSFKRGVKKLNFPKLDYMDADAYHVEYKDKQGKFVYGLPRGHFRLGDKVYTLNEKELEIVSDFVKDYLYVNVELEEELKRLGVTYNIVHTYNDVVELNNKERESAKFKIIFRRKDKIYEIDYQISPHQTYFEYFPNINNILIDFLSFYVEEDFEEYCWAFGLDGDSIKDKENFEYVKDIDKKINNLFSISEINNIKCIFGSEYFDIE